MLGYKDNGLGIGMAVEAQQAITAELVAQIVARQSGLGEVTLAPARVGDRPAVALCDTVLDASVDLTDHAQVDPRLAFLVAYEGPFDDPLHGTTTRFQIYGPQADTYLRARINQEVARLPKS